MVDVIKILRESGYELLEHEAEDVSRWRGLRHNKDDLQLFLTFNVAEIEFLPEGGKKAVRIVCTGNKRLIAAYSAVKAPDRKLALKTPMRGLRTAKTGTVLAYDLAAGKVVTVPLRSWRVISFLTITEENAPLLDEVLRRTLRKKAG